MESASATPSSVNASAKQRPGLRLLLKCGLGLAIGFGGMAGWNLLHRPAETVAGPEAQPAKRDGTNTTKPDTAGFQARAGSLSQPATKEEISALAKDWMAKDPDGAIAWMRGLPSSFDKEKLLSEQASGLLSKDLPHAIQLIESMSRSSSRGRMELGYVSRLAEKDAAAASAYARENLAGVTQIEAFQNIASRLLETDPRAAWDMVKQDGLLDVSAISLRRQEHVHKSGSGSSTYGGNPLEKIYKMASEQFPREAAEQLYRTVNLNDAATNPPTMEMFRDGIAQYFRQSINNWFAANPSEVTVWFQSQPTTEATASVATLIANQLAGSDPAGAKAFVLAQPEGSIRDGALTGLAENIASAPELLPWLQTQGKTSSVNSVILKLAETNPSLVAQNFSMLNSDNQARCVGVILSGLAASQPEQMVSFYRSLPAASQAEVDLHNTTKQYANQNPEAASLWVDALPASAAKNHAIGGLVEYLTGQSLNPDFSAAAQWAASTSVPQSAEAYLSAVATAWKKQDPNAATAISQSALSTSVKETLLKYVSPKP